MNPSTGLFTSLDTFEGYLSEPDSLHKYLFAGSNPIRNCDPTGHNEMLIEQTTVIGIISILAEPVLNILKVVGISIVVIAAMEIAGSISTRLRTVSLLIDGLLVNSLSLAKQYIKANADDIAKAIAKVVEAAAAVSALRIYEVYLLPRAQEEKTQIDLSDILYVGRSKNFEKYRKYYHERTKPQCDVEKAVIIPGLTYEESRVYEQELMIYYHTRQWMDNNGYNKIPGIGKNNDKYDKCPQVLLSYTENLLEEEVLMMKELLMPLH